MTEDFDFLSIKDFCNRYASIITEGSLRWILFNSKFNGANVFVRRLGRRKLVISPKLFFEWLNSRTRKEQGETGDCRS
jgi:hypothetical protein